MPSSPITVLVVDDEHDIADLYARWLADEYEVLVAHTGREALEALDERVNVVLLDRRIPDVHGDDVLDRINKRGLQCQVAMVTAVEPELDIITMGFDDYLVKPVTSDDLLETVATLVARSEYESGLRELFAAVSKRAVLLDQYPAEELADNPEYEELEGQITRDRDRLDALVGEVSDEAFPQILRDVVGDSSDGTDNAADIPDGTDVGADN